MTRESRWGRLASLWGGEGGGLCIPKPLAALWGCYLLTVWFSSKYSTPGASKGLSVSQNKGTTGIQGDSRVKNNAHHSWHLVRAQQIMVLLLCSPWSFVSD